MLGAEACSRTWRQREHAEYSRGIQEAIRGSETHGIRFIHDGGGNCCGGRGHLGHPQAIPKRKRCHSPSHQHTTDEKPTENHVENPDEIAGKTHRSDIAKRLVIATISTIPTFTVTMLTFGGIALPTG